MLFGTYARLAIRTNTQSCIPSMGELSACVFLKNLNFVNKNLDIFGSPRQPSLAACHQNMIFFFSVFTNFGLLENLSTIAALRLRIHRHRHTVVVNPLCSGTIPLCIYSVRVKMVAMFSIEWFERSAHRRYAAKISEPEYEICRLSNSRIYEYTYIVREWLRLLFFFFCP